MILAVSGQIVIGVAVGGAVLLVFVLLRADARDEAREAAVRDAEPPPEDVDRMRG